MRVAFEDKHAVPTPGVKRSRGQAAQTRADHDRIEVSSHEITISAERVPHRNAMQLEMDQRDACDGARSFKS